MHGIVPVILMATSINPAGAQRPAAVTPPIDARGTVYYRALDNPAGMPGGDAAMTRWAVQAKARARSDAVFAALSALLGGTSPALNFVRTGSPLLTPPGHLSANTRDLPGAPAGSINLDPLAAVSITDDTVTGHSAAVNQLPHEMAHLRQLAEILANAPDREGGAQSFADLVAETAAQRAGIPYVPGDFDGRYADYVKAINAQKTRDWILAGQFGRAGSPLWP